MLLLCCFELVFAPPFSPSLFCVVLVSCVLAFLVRPRCGVCLSCVRVRFFRCVSLLFASCCCAVCVSLRFCMVYVPVVCFSCFVGFPAFCCLVYNVVLCVPCCVFVCVFCVGLIVVLLFGMWLCCFLFVCFVFLFVAWCVCMCFVFLAVLMFTPFVVYYTMLWMLFLVVLLSVWFVLV